MAVAPPGTRCGRHPELAATVICRRCGTFCCPDCLELPSSEELCVACAARPALQGDRGFNLAALALVASFLGLGCVPLAPVGVVLSAWLLTRQRDEDATRSRVLPLAALALGVVAIAVAGWLALRIWQRGGLVLPDE